MAFLSRAARRFAIVCLFLGFGQVARAADWYVSPAGSQGNSGNIDSPWDLASALNGFHAVSPGDTLWVRGGTYKAAWPTVQDPTGYGFIVKLAGAAGLPITVRPFPSERATIDGGLNIQAPASHLWIRDFEILVSEPRKIVGPDGDTGRPWGGLNVFYGTGMKFINLVIHGNCMGVGFWTPPVDSEIYGCLIYNNGYYTSDGAGNGPGIYTQNGETSYKHITDNLIAGNYASYGFKAYSTKDFANNYIIEGNIVYDQKQFLVGAVGPSNNIYVRENYLYGASMEIGYKYYSGWNVNCEVVNNVIGDNYLTITRFESVVNLGNQVVPKYFKRPRTATVKLRPNRHDPSRAHLAIFNWPRKSTVTFNPGAFLKAGDTYRLIDPKNLFGSPIRTGVYGGSSITVPVTGEFAAFVIVK